MIDLKTNMIIEIYNFKALKYFFFYIGQFVTSTRKVVYVIVSEHRVNYSFSASEFTTCERPSPLHLDFIVFPIQSVEKDGVI